MAWAYAKSAIGYLEKLLWDEGIYVWGIEDKLNELRRELIWMQCFLRDADSHTHDEFVSQWVLEVKEHVSEAEDIVDRFVIEVASRRRQNNWRNKVERWSCIGREVYGMHKATSSIDTLLGKMGKLTLRLQNYGLRTSYGMEMITGDSVSERVQQHSYDHLNVKKIIGLEKDINVVVDMLLNPTTNKRVVAIYGMGGLGKTTLAAGVFIHKKVRCHFKDGVAWAYVSKNCQVQTVFQNLLADLTSKSIKEMTGKKVEDLILELRDFLQKHKCLVVLDDVWTVETWDLLSDAFPQRIGSESMVFLITRKEEVAKYADRSAIPKPDPLDASTGWVLLKETLGWDIGKNDVQGDIGGNDNGGSEMAEMFGSKGVEVISLGKEMVKHCNGIPLAIVVLGGILRKKEFVEEWRAVRENFISYLRRGYDRGRSYMEVLALSYNDLPYHLKPFFLHLGSFPEGHEIRAEKLCRMWVSEGLVTQPRDSVVINESVEDVARGYLADLVRAGMLEIVSKGSKGKIQSVRMHDLMRDLCVQKAVTDNFLSIVDHRQCSNEPHYISSFANYARMMRLAIYLAPDASNQIPDPLNYKAYECVRTMLFFVGRGYSGGDCEQLMNDIFEKFPYMRVLDMEGVCSRGKLTQKIQKAIHLRYLSLKETVISELPSCISKLRFIETLDLRVSYSGSPMKIPNVLSKLERLRHLFLPKKPYDIVKDERLRLNTLCKLETLKHFEVQKCQIEDFPLLKKLKKFSIKDGVSDVEIEVIVESPAIRLGTLRDCSLTVMGSVMDTDPSLLWRMNCLTKLIVKDKISDMRNNTLPRYLEVLHFESSQLDVDPMGVLGCLRCLRELKLGNNSFMGDTMTCLEDSFLQLVKLELHGLTGLVSWIVKKSSMPVLKKVLIRDCINLEKIPDEVPISVHIKCSPCIDGIEKYDSCVCYASSSVHVLNSLNCPITFSIDTGVFAAELMKANKVVLSGIGGYSKSSLVGMLQDDAIRSAFDVVWDRFPRIPESIPPRHFRVGILRQLAPDMSNIHLMSNGDILHKINNIAQNKKCLIVLTDWKYSQSLLDAFGGLITVDKVLLTTHEEQAPGDVHHVLQLSPLTDDESEELFQKRVGLDSDSEKQELVRKMLPCCSNQVLPTVMLAGLLSTKDRVSEWQSFEMKLSLCMKEAQGLDSLYELMIEELPANLKRCFFYFAIFPEDMQIATSKLYKLWIACGFVKVNGGGDLMELWEDIAEKYLMELVGRGLVQIGKKGTTGRISRVWVEPTLWKL